MKRTHTFYGDNYEFDHLGNMTVTKDPRYKYARAVDWVVNAIAIGAVAVACATLFWR